MQEASWQWDGEADGADEAPSDVLGGGRGEGDGPRRLSRRGLLVGAGVLAAGGAAWALSRTGDDRTVPVPDPTPTALSGPTPLWTYRGAQPMTPERLLSAPHHPVFLSKAGLQVLDPETGAARRLVVFDPPRPADLSSDVELTGGSVVVGPDHLFSATSRGHLDAHHLTDPAADWSLPLPDQPQGGLQLAGLDDGVLYGYIWGWPRTDGTTASSQVLAVRIADHSVLWSVSSEHQERPIAPASRGGDTRLLICTRSVGSGTALVARDAATGREQWTVTGGSDLSWCVANGPGFLIPDGGSGVRTLGPDGRLGWTYSPARGESWRVLPPVAAGPRVFVLRDNGTVTGHDMATGAVVWSYRLPFLLDSRCRPLFVESTGLLYVPGPAAGGVCALNGATGEPAWTFRDSGPGRDVWTVSTDGSRLYAGHDDVLHALPLG
ncbi:PQQ-binding-like beta-propeller repeat protein [Kitasatospora sp. NPDC094011]|uniref:outer membrane protein assembly factor BamB family protein n=1 Tax=Kitasatospora sp. NPDC094011 TaxID=3364090 RepID=UPI0037F76529